jgi:transposase
MLQNKTVHQNKREKAIALWSLGYKQQDIATTLRLSFQTVSNIINRFIRFGAILPGKTGWKERTISTPQVVEFVEYCKVSKPSTSASELQEALIENDVCTIDNIPARSTISDILRKDLNFTWKKLSVRPAESLTEENIQRTLDYIMYMSGLDPSTVHFFDESSVVKTTPNRTYGHSKKGTRAVEVKRYSSNCTYTVNLLHNRFGVAHFNILEGPSNGLEMLEFFEESLEVINEHGNPVLANGDTVVMDNCGFHHGRFAENELRQMLGNRGVTLIFQPPYSPEFNTCEFCFRSMKAYLRKHEQFSINFTEVAIIQALQSITPAMSHNIFRHCGFVL